MKKLTNRQIVIARIAIVAALGIAACTGNQPHASPFRNGKFVAITPEMGTMKFMTESGRLGELGSTQTYFVSLIKEDGPFYERADSVHLKQGFIVLKLRREKSNYDNLAYRMLDSMNECEAAFGAQIDDPHARFSDEEKRYYQALRDQSIEVRRRFHESVRVYVEPEAIETGISHKCYLKYEPQPEDISGGPRKFNIMGCPMPDSVDSFTIPPGGYETKNVDGRQIYVRMGDGRPICEIIDSILANPYSSPSTAQK